MLGRYRERVRVWSDPVGRVLFRLHLRPNHLTLTGLGVSLLASAAFITGHTAWAAVLLILAGLFDLLDGSLARVSGQVTPFGAFFDSVVDRYSDLVVLLGVVVLFAGMPHARGALIAMAGLVGSVMVSYTRARAESIGVECRVGLMERPERMICLIVGALFDLLEPAIWIIAILANLTALQRIAFTWRATRGAEMLRAALLAALLLTPGPAAAEPAPARPVAPASARSWAEAVAAFQQGLADPLVLAFGRDEALQSPIGDHVRWLLADALARRGALAAARAVALGIADHHPRSRLAPAALVLAATLASRAGDEAGAQAALTRLIDAYPDAAELPAALYLLGMTGEARGQLEPAAHAYRQLRVLAPASTWADGADDRLAALAAAGVELPPLPLADRVARAERLLRAGLAERALEEAQAVADETREPRLVLRALGVVSSAAQRLRRYQPAARALEQAIDVAPASRRPALQLELARVLVRAAQRERALTVLATVASTGSEAEAAEARFQRARTLDLMGRAGEAASAYEAVAARYPARDVAGASLWRLGWLAYLGGDLPSAEERWSRLDAAPGGRSYRAGGLYWRARASEQLRGPAAAAPLYRQVLAEAPRSYYGLLASARMSSAPAGPRPPAVQLPANPEEAVAGDPDYARFELLRRVGLVEHALDELDGVVQRAIGDPARLYGLSAAYLREERYHLALRVLRRYFTGVASTGSPALPTAFWEMLYPLGWRAELTEVAGRAGIDPFLVAAVVREESNYHPRAVSRAGARGLMQLMPATAEALAESHGLRFVDGLLDDPRANLQLGTAFLASLLREFADPRLALAAYNAGPGRLRQWQRARGAGDIEVFVEQIPFDETRQYVKRVMLSWEEYRRIYGGP